jgi:hypothetical protein
MFEKKINELLFSYSCLNEEKNMDFWKNYYNTNHNYVDQYYENKNTRRNK